MIVRSWMNFWTVQSGNLRIINVKIMIDMKAVFILLLLAFSYLQVVSQPPNRKALMGLWLKDSENGLVVDSFRANGTFINSKLKAGDVLLSVNNKEVKTMKDYNSIVSSVRAGEKITYAWLHNKKENKGIIEAIARPYEKSELADIHYDWVNFRNGQLRAVTYVPKNKTGVPAILLIPGYGCGSIENYLLSYNGKLIMEWVKAGYAVITIEKSGMGDSYGCKPCTDVDLVTDVESFDQGYKFMEALPYVDKKNLFIWGHSMGGTIAPEVAKRHSPKGVMVFACVFRPWNEFLLEMHRVQKPLLDGLTYTQTEVFLRGIQPVYNSFFNEKKSPEELHSVPEYRAIVESEFGYKPGSNDLWGRHWKFWQQLDSFNLAESWHSLNCPVLVIHGGADYEQCSQVEPLMIRETVNEAHPGNATKVTIDDLDHFMMKSKDWKEAQKNFKEQQFNKGNFNYRISQETINWLKTKSG